MERSGCVRAHGKHQRVGCYIPSDTPSVVPLSWLYTSSPRWAFLLPSFWVVCMVSEFLFMCLRETVPWPTAMPVLMNAAVSTCLCSRPWSFSLCHSDSLLLSYFLISFVEQWWWPICAFYNVLIQPCSCCSVCWEHSILFLLAFSGSAFSSCFPNGLGLSVVAIILCRLWSCSHKTASKHENISLWRVCVYFPDFFCAFTTEEFKASSC